MPSINCSVKVGDIHSSFPFKLHNEEGAFFILLRTEDEDKPVRIPLDASRIVKISEKPEVYSYKGILVEFHPQQK